MKYRVKQGEEFEIEDAKVVESDIEIVLGLRVKGARKLAGLIALTAFIAFGVLGVATGDYHPFDAMERILSKGVATIHGKG
jgi:hypothetical protein